MSSWRNDIQFLVKKCLILALYFFPKCRIGVECLTRLGTEFMLTAALLVHLHQQAIMCATYFLCFFFFLSSGECFPSLHVHQGVVSQICSLVLTANSSFH
jgi:hypothetical protein